MEKNQYKKNAEDMLYLTVCAVKGKKPDSKRMETMDLDGLFKVCQKNILTACAAYALESAGVRHHAFTQAKEKAIRKNVLLDAERRKILNRLEQEKIWYMPLKGAILKNLYPKLGMRQMSDNDILFDKKYRTKVKNIMLDLGFTCKSFNSGNDDAYFKPPICNFEMHSSLFASAHIGKLYEYYQNIKQKLIRDENSQYGYHFRTEDFYVYLTAHEYKHFTAGGVGVRSLVDAYIFMKKYGDSMNWDYLNAELKKLKIQNYEQKRRIIAEKIFNEQELSEKETAMLNYYIFSGSYGTRKNAIKHKVNRLGKGSKAHYLFRRIFPPMEEIESYWNFFYRHKWLIPILWIYRPIKGLLTKRKKLFREIKYLCRSSGKNK